MKILIVEDNEDSRNLLSKQLRAYGHEVVSANNGVEALKQALEDAPDVLVSDIQMPEMDGYQLCREWKQNDRLKDIPVVFYTATYTSPEDEKFALNLGAAAFVRKPTEPHVLVKILSEIIERAASGLLSAPAGKLLEQYEYLEEHNRRLVTKLQKKIEDLNLEVSEHKKTETALRASEERFRGTLDAMLEGYQIIGYDWRYLYINPVAAAQGHYERNRYYEHTMMELYPGIEKTEMFQAIQKCMQENRPDRIENEFTYPDGTKSWFDLSIEPVPEGVLVLSVDISELKKAESDIIRINRMLRTISECNQLLVRATDEQELLDKICDLVVRSEGFPLAWVGFAENDADKTVRPVAFVGSVSEYLNNLKISWADNEFGRGPVGVAIRTGKTCIARLGTAGSDFPRWHALAEQYGFNSSIALPLISDGNTIGSLNIYAKDEFAFNEERVKLLKELADDLAYGIAVLRRRHELDIATENLARSEKKYSTLVEQSNDGIIIIKDGVIKFANREMIRMTGFTFKETIGKPLIDFVSPRYKELVSERYTRRMAGEDVPNRYEIEINRKDGNIIPAEINASIIEHEDCLADMAIIRDITERKEAEEALKESESKYRLLVENIPVGVAIMRGAKILFTNSQNEQMSGYTIEELKNINPYDVIYEEDRARVTEYAAMRARGEPAPGSYDVRIIHKDGSLRWLRRSVVRIDWLGEKASLIIDADITERKKAEEALKESEERFRQVADSADEWIWEVDADGVYTYSSPAVERILGYTPEEIIGKKHYYDLYPADVREEFTKTSMAVAEQKQSFSSFANPNVHKNGSIVILDTTATPVLDKEGNLLGYRGVDMDITERKKAEQALKESEERYRTFAESTHEIIQSIDTDGSILFVNKAWHDILGYSEEDLSTISLTDIIHPDSMEHCNNMFREVMSGKSFPFVEAKFKKKDGSIVYVEGSAAPRFLGDKVIATQGFYADVTERNKAEEALRQEKDYAQSIVNTAQAIILTLDTKGRIVDFNPYMEEISGYTIEEVRGKNWLNTFLPERNRQKTRELFSTAIGGRKTAGNIDIIVTKNGEERFIDWHDTTVKDKDGKIIGLLAVGQDITDRNKAEEALKKSEERFRIAQEMSPDGFTILHPLRNEKGEIVDFTWIYENQAIARINGTDLEEIKGKRLLDLFPTHKTTSVFETYIHVANSGKLRIIEEVYVGEIISRPTWLRMVIVSMGEDIAILAQDITESKKSQQALEEAETRRRILLEQSRDGIVILNQEGGVQEANKRFAEMLGYSTEEVLKLHVWDWEYQSSREEVIEVLKGADEKGDHFETKHRRKDGSIYDVEISTNGAIFAEQKLIFCVCRDITERKEAEGKIRISEEKYRTLFETMAQGVVYQNREGKIISANRAAEHILGLTLSQMQGRTSFDPRWHAVHEDGSPFPGDEHPAVVSLKTGKAVRDVVMGVFNIKEKGYRWIVINAIPQFRENEKEAYQVYTTFNDITQIKQIEKALIQSESKLRESLDSWETTFNSMSDAICLLALDGTIVRCNQAMNELVGKPGENIMGQKCYKLVHGSENHIEGCPHLKMLESGHREAFECMVGDKWFYTVVDPIFDDKGAITGSVHIMEDITERKKMEERMIMTDRLASIGELSSGIAHELNNPLTSVIGIIQLLMERDDIPDEILKDLQLVNSEGQRAARVVKNLLVFARKHSNQVQLSSINQAVEKVLELRAYDQKVNNIQVIRDFAPDLPQIVMDYFQIQQVFLNIVINAEFAMKEAHNEGTLVIKTETVGEMVRVSFKDDGPGISGENLKRIFNPFFTTKEVGKGTGLGLSICHGIISQHGGNIYAESESGKGATFVIELPINPPEQIEGMSNDVNS
ncbi:MAG: PAS domain S-box protein [Dehalococcoidales bacterium]|nr:PAS domain S-box protein [Dehalococcoidales bacterium]